MISIATAHTVVNETPTEIDFLHSFLDRLIESGDLPVTSALRPEDDYSEEPGQGETYHHV